ncbi:TPA: PD-(D/E)XK motif protein [Clostridium perfringens]
MTSFFLVDETFPRIKQNDLSSGIVKVSYKILINSIDKYLKVGVLNEN